MKSKLIVLAMTGVVVLSSGVALACRCSDADPFLSVAQRAPFIVRATVVSHSQTAMDLEIQEIYRGEESRSIVRVWGDNGAACRSRASDFPDRSEWVFALHPVSDGPLFYRNEPSSDFQISSCGEYALVVDGSVAKSAEGSAHDTEVRLAELGRDIDVWGEFR